MTDHAWRMAAIVSAAILWGGPLLAQTGEETAPAPVSASTADHSKFEALKKLFTSGPEVTQACLSCHTEASDQVMHTVHWQWAYTQPDTGQSNLGKSNVLNSFCGNVAGNEARCTSCHIGYGWTDVREAAPQDPTRVDCLACHDTTGAYAKLDNKAGNPPLDPLPAGARTITGELASVVNLAEIAQKVGEPGRENCGNCHFYGGGGDNVKHGDLSSALYEPELAVDVHMSAEGAGFTCTSCHVSESHAITGSRYDTNVTDPHAEDRPAGAAPEVAACSACHSESPHATTVIGLKLNDHTDTLACQSCHIPEFARGGIATKTLWDWSTAGQLGADGKVISTEGYVQGDGKALHSYISTKGTFAWAENVVPYYAWFDGDVSFTVPDQPIDPSRRLEINRLSGSADDPDARIFPFKRMEGRQPYDTGSNLLAYNHTYGPGTETAFWVNFDWDKSLQAGMEYVGAAYSGSYDFIDTYMYWPITHMVAPAADAVDCVECHSPGGRLATVAGIYVPGSGLGPGGKLGLLMLIATALGMAGHGAIRLLRRGRKTNGGADHG